MDPKIAFLLFCACIDPILSARILGIASTPSYSHQIVFRPIWRELSLRGHQLTVLTTDPIKDPSLTNLREIDLHHSYQLFNEENMANISDAGIIEMFNGFIRLNIDLLDLQLKHLEVKALIEDKNAQFDLLLVEGIFPTGMAFAKRFNCPFIEIVSLDASSYVYHIMGNPSHPVLNPEFMLGFSGRLSFRERFISVAYTVLFTYFYNSWMIPQQDLLINKHFGDGYPSLTDIRSNVSMLLVNTDTILHPIRPLLPNIIQFGGGIHLNPPKPLPKDLQKYLDSASEGVIYFSLGSNVKSNLLPENIRKVLLETFAELPYKVLWKFEDEDLPGKSDNVLISKWLSQQDVLRHPNIILFITQGGLQSMEEAIHNHIPLIGIPFIGDQAANVRNMVDKGLGLSIDPQTLEKTLLKTTILEVIKNPKYRGKTKELAELVADQPMKGLDRAIWWIEYVLRHKGAKHLRSPAIDLPLYQYFLLDVIGFCILVISVVTFVLLKLVKLVYKIFTYLVTKPKVKVQ